MNNCHVLIVDDDAKVRTLLRRCLEPEGCQIAEACNAAEAMAAVRSGGISLITLDLQLGSDDGLDVARDIQAISDVPIVMVTGKDDVIDKIVGLELGADDYIIKPFHVREVVARLRAVMRRSQANASATPAPMSATSLRFDGLTATPDLFDLRSRDGDRIEITSTEFRLLNAFLERPKRVMSREQLLTALGGHDYAPFDRTIDNLVARLRKKVERDPHAPRVITTVRGVGYSLSVDVENV